MHRFIPLLLLLFANKLLAQPTTPPAGPPTTPRIAAVAPVDTTPLAYTFPQTPERLEPERDTLPDYPLSYLQPGAPAGGWITVRWAIWGRPRGLCFSRRSLDAVSTWAFTPLTCIICDPTICDFIAMPARTATCFFRRVAASKRGC